MSNQTITASDREIVSVRVVNASREIVFKAWTDPQHLRSWWGPNGFTNTFHEFDLKPEGHWRFTMHGPDGHRLCKSQRLCRNYKTRKTRI